MTEITVIKQDPFGREKIRWPARLLERLDRHIVVEAIFTIQGATWEDVSLEPGDRFVETYYSDRDYNCFEVHHHADDHVKCWYYNITAPAEFNGDTIVFRDLVLDLLVYPDGHRQILDEDELEEIDLPAEDKQRIRQALQDLIGELDAK